MSKIAPAHGTHTRRISIDRVYYDVTYDLDSDEDLYTGRVFPIVTLQSIKPSQPIERGDLSDYFITFVEDYLAEVVSEEAHALNTLDDGLDDDRPYVRDE